MVNYVSIREESFSNLTQNSICTPLRRSACYVPRYLKGKAWEVIDTQELVKFAVEGQRGSLMPVVSKSIVSYTRCHYHEAA